MSVFSKRKFLGFLLLGVLFLLDTFLILQIKLKKPQEPVYVSTQKGVLKLPKEPEHQVIKAENRLVKGFPEVPVHPQAELVGSSQTTDYTGIHYEAGWKIKGTSPDYLDWYVKALAEQGWKITEKPEGVDYLTPQLLIFSKNEQKLELGLVPEDGNTVTRVILRIL